MQRYQWLEPEQTPNTAYNLHDCPLICMILSRRGISDPAAARAFLSPSLAQLNDPRDLPDLELACTRISAAIDAGRRIAVFGDYDVDGITSTTILVRALQELGADVRAFLPNRLTDGYGLNERLVRDIIETGAGLLITVDCGTGDAEELALARQAGLETVVIDHHQVHEPLRDGTAFVSPQRPDSTYPFRPLAAVGVTFHLVRALLGDERAKTYLPYVALGTVADVVPLIGENRVLVAAGLQAMAKNAPLGLRALAEEAGVDLRQVASWHLGFLLGPRLNAAGRMNDPRIALDLFLTDDTLEARRLARELGRLNAQRQQTMEQMLGSVDARIEALGPHLPHVLVVAEPEWSIGLVGLVASRLSERFNRPAFAIGGDSGISRGSARSIDGFDVGEALRACDDLLLEYGGHSKAAGFTLQSSLVDQFDARLNALARERLGDEIPAPALMLDAELHPPELTLATALTISTLEPFGQENEAPRFFVRGARIHDPQRTRDGRHLRFGVSSPGRPRVNAIYFNGADAHADLLRHGTVDLAFRMRVERWRGSQNLSLEVIDYRASTA